MDKCNFVRCLLLKGSPENYPKGLVKIGWLTAETVFIVGEPGHIFPGQLLLWQVLPAKNDKKNQGLKFGWIGTVWPDCLIDYLVGWYVQSHFHVKPNLGYVRLNFGWVWVLTIKDSVMSKGPLNNYVIFLGGGGEVPKRLHKITRGLVDTPKDYIRLQGGSIWSNPSIDKV